MHASQRPQIQRTCPCLILNENLNQKLRKSTSGRIGTLPGKEKPAPGEMRLSSNLLQKDTPPPSEVAERVSIIIVFTESEKSLSSMSLIFPVTGEPTDSCPERPT